MADNVALATTALKVGMNGTCSRVLASLVCLSAAAGCDGWTDAATRLAFDIEASAGRLGGQNGAKYSIRHNTPSKAGECTGPYTVQVDKVGAIVIWCKDEAGRTVSSHSTTYHGRFVDTPRTYILEKPAGATLTIDLERRNGRAVVTDVR
jgi:hypothetical protein